MPKISIIIPTYNSEKYLKECLNSAVNQTFKDIEIIVVDSASIDSTISIVEEYMKNDNRIKLIRRPKELVGPSRNAAILEATGDYLMFLDSDDWYELKTCELVYNIIEETKTDFLIFGSQDVYPDECKKYVQGFVDMCNRYGQASINDEDACRYLAFTGCEAWKKIYKRDFIINNNIRFSQHEFGEDLPFYWDCLINMKTVSLCNEWLYNYRKALNVNTSSINERYEINYNVYSYVYDRLSKSPKKDMYIKFFMVTMVRNYRWWIHLLREDIVPKYFKRMKEEFEKYNKELDLKLLLEGKFQKELDFINSILNGDY